MSVSRPAPQVDIVVVVRDLPESLRHRVDGLLAQLQDAGRGIVRNVVRLQVDRGGTVAAAIDRALAAPGADAVLLDARAIVTRGWLDALVRCARSDPRIATVTPFSNGTGLSPFPRLHDRELEDADAERIAAALAAAAVPTWPDVPVGGGACIYVRRAALDALGGFDAAFESGTGLQRDFCLRALRVGWRNVLADDAFVGVAGPAVDPARDDASARDDARLADRDPHYADVPRAFAAADPLRPLREAARFRLGTTDDARGVLHVIHDHGGGTETHVRALIDATRERWRHCIATAVGDRWQVDQYLDDGATRRFEFVRGEDESWPAFVRGIVTTFGIGLVHVHHLSRSRAGVLAALPSLGLPYGITVHDLWLACPTVTLTRADGRYCGGVTDAVLCTRCLGALGTFAGADIGSWRSDHAAFVAGAAFLIAPSQWAADMLLRYFPGARSRISVIAHATPNAWALSPPARGPDRPTSAVLLPDDDISSVAIVGAIGRDKGARRIERLVQRARARSARLRFVVIGYLDVQHAPWQSADAMLTVHGRYSVPELPALFRHYRVALAAYPSEGPESFSYTLSETWAAGLPALVPPIAALAERVTQSGAGWVLTDDEWHDEDRMLDRIVALAGPTSAAVRAAASANARAAAATVGAGMADATSERYELARADAQSTVSPGVPIECFSALRLRDALGYVGWAAPAMTAAKDAAAVEAQTLRGGRGDPARAPLAGFAHWALSIRRTAPGRLLYRIAPSALIEVLKSRLGGGR